MGKKWTPQEVEKLRQLYPNNYTKDLEPVFGRSYKSLASAARDLKLHKSEAFRKKQLANQVERLQKDGEPFRFKKGLIPFNKGKKQTEFLSAKGIEASSKTRFKKGIEPHNTKYDGYERLSKDGYIEVRVSKGKFKLKHRLIWEQLHGPIPQGCIVRFKDGNKRNFDPDNLEMITRVEHALRNGPAQMHPQMIPKVASYIQIKKKIKSLIQ